MLGPVISHSRSSAPSAQVVGDEALARVGQSALSTTGWRPPSMSRQGSSVRCGRHQPPSAARAAWLAATSIRAIASAVAVMRGAAATASAVSSSACAASAASACAPASTTRAASACSSGELKRTTPASVWRWVKPLSGAISRSACRADDLDMIAEHGIVADLERRDAGRCRGSGFRARRSPGGRRTRRRASVSSAAS